MHAQAYSFVVHSLIRTGIEGKCLLEIGSFDVNGTEQGMSLRDLCQGAASYYGIDERDGPGVDEAAGAADYDGKAAFDICVTTEALEHAPEPTHIIQCAWRALKGGGLLIVTAAGEGRAAHNCDGEAWSGVEPYENVTRAALEGWLEGWEAVAISEDTAAHDIYATARKPRR